MGLKSFTTGMWNGIKEKAVSIEKAIGAVDDVVSASRKMEEGIDSLGPREAGSRIDMASMMLSSNTKKNAYKRAWDIGKKNISNDMMQVSGAFSVGNMLYEKSMGAKDGESEQDTAIRQLASNISATIAGAGFGASLHMTKRAAPSLRHAAREMAMVGEEAQDWALGSQRRQSGFKPDIGTGPAKRRRTVDGAFTRMVPEKNRITIDQKTGERENG